MCAFDKKIPAGPSIERRRAEYSSDKLAEVLSRMTPEWQDIATQHMVAQALVETGNLKFMQELKSEHASSTSAYPGCGLIMTTHKSNYAKLAGCADVIAANPPPEKIPVSAIARAPYDYSSDLVEKSCRAMNESTERGRDLVALGLVCYMVDNSERHGALETALKSSHPSCVHEVGVAVNQGPGNLGLNRRAYSADERLKAFNDIQSCFSTRTNNAPCLSYKRGL